jgi:hypothetical protein
MPGRKSADPLGSDRQFVRSLLFSPLVALYWPLQVPFYVCLLFVSAARDNMDIDISVQAQQTIDDGTAQ